MESFVFVTDFHGDMHEPKAYRGFRGFMDAFRPKFRVFGGDLWDFRALRSGADEEEKRQSMRRDFGEGMEFMEFYRPHVITLGNHDQRLWDAVKKGGMNKSGPIADYASELIEKFEKLAEKLGTIVVPYNKRKVFRRGGITFVHGFDNMDPVKMANVYGNVMYGHGHAIKMATAPAIETRTARMVGALARKELIYNRSQINTLNQEHGWGYGAFLGGRKHEVFQARFNGNEVIFAESLKALRV